jgi:hypothetical protein
LAGFSRSVAACATRVTPFFFNVLAAAAGIFVFLQACDALVQLIKDHGRWVDLPVEEEEGAAAAQAAVAV